MGKASMATPRFENTPDRIRLGEHAVFVTYILQYAMPVPSHSGVTNGQLRLAILPYVCLGLPGVCSQPLSSPHVSPFPLEICWLPCVESRRKKGVRG